MTHVFSKPVTTSQKEKSLKQSATKGVVKFLNLVLNYQENSSTKANKGEDNKSNIKMNTKKRKAMNEESKIKASRFGAVVGLHSDK